MISRSLRATLVGEVVPNSHTHSARKCTAVLLHRNLSQLVAKPSDRGALG